jgi:hypothetical protein
LNNITVNNMFIGTIQYLSRRSSDQLAEPAACQGALLRYRPARSTALAVRVARRNAAAISPLRGASIPAARFAFGNIFLDGVVDAKFPEGFGGLMAPSVPALKAAPIPAISTSFTYLQSTPGG